MQIILAGNWHSDVHEEPMSDALQTLGCVVHPFRWHRYFQQIQESNWVLSTLFRIQRRFSWGPTVTRLNQDLVSLAKTHQADALFVYRGDMIQPETLRQIRAICPHTVIVGYNNDDPFSPHYPSWLWRHFIKAIPEYDLVLAYRHTNIDDFQRAGARQVKLLRSWYVPERHHPLTGKHSEKKYDVVFVGHYENDGRQSMLEAIVREGYSLGLYGPGYDWDPKIDSSPELKHQIPVSLVWGEAYNRVLNQGRVALCFCSGLNRDTYTRRCFEIPASGTIMLAQYSEDLASLFEPDKEAVYFTSKSELLEKLQRLIADPVLCQKIAEAGNRKVREAGHDVLSRMKTVTNWIEEAGREKNETATF